MALCRLKTGGADYLAEPASMSIEGAMEPRNRKAQVIQQGFRPNSQMVVSARAGTRKRSGRCHSGRRTRGAGRGDVQC
jgi:hypothetical protein